MRASKRKTYIVDTFSERPEELRKRILKSGMMLRSILRFIWASLIQEKIWLVMEYLDGGTLTHAVADFLCPI